MDWNSTQDIFIVDADNDLIDLLDLKFFNGGFRVIGASDGKMGFDLA